MLRATLRDLERLGRRATRRTTVTWRYGANLGPTLAYRRSTDRPTGEGARVLADLNRDGVAVTSLEALLDHDSADALYAATDDLRRNRAAEVDAARRGLADPDPTTQKPFVVSLRGGTLDLDPSGALGRFALDPRVVAVANAYYEMFVKLRYYDIWHTLATDDPPSQSQLWHRDPEDRQILKVFVALEDVGPGNGPFTYAAGSHAKGDASHPPDHLHKDGRTTRSSDAQMAAVVPSERWVTGTGPRGTMIFADTRGYHRGGLARDGDRVLFVAQYLSRAAGRGGVPTTHHHDPRR